MSNLNKIISAIEEILKDENKLKTYMKEELRKIKQEYGVERKTLIKDEITEIKIDTTMMIPKEDVIVVVSKDGYVKRVSLRSYSASMNEDTLVKEDDYVIGLYEMNTLDTLLLFTNLGNYLYVPVNDIPDTKWKEIGKHISNIIPIKEGEEIVSSMPVYDFDKEVYITTFTKNGMVKRSLLKDYRLSRYSKPVCNIKLKDDDIVVDVSYDNYSYALVTTNTGYSLMFNASEIPVTQVKSGGVKSIKLKDDFVVSGCMLDDNYEYVLVVTNKGTMKRLKLTDIEISNRAKRGQIILREVKTNPHRIIKVLKLTGKEDVLIKNNNDIDIIKSTSIPIMDRYSTGSSYAKSIMDACIDTKIEDESIYEIKEKKVEHVKKEDISLSDIDKKILTIDDMLKEMK